MEGTLLLEMGRKVGLCASVIGILAGIDLLTGAKVIRSLKSLLDKAFDIDNLIIKISSAFRKSLDRVFNFDEVAMKDRTRITLGVLLLVVSITMIIMNLCIH